MRDSQRIVSGGPASVMVVDDEPEVLKLLVRILQRAGHDVTACAGIDEAHAHLAKGKMPALLITDVVLKGSTGKRVARLVQDKSPKTRVIFISGYDNVAVGGQPVLQKPFTPNELAELVDRVLAAPSQAQATQAEAVFDATRRNKP